MKWISYHTKSASEKFLFRFLSLRHINKFLESGNLWFSRSDTFGDKMECVLISDLEKDSPDFKSIEKRKRKTLINCWHLADEESLAMWDTYSKTEDERRVCAIRFKRNDLNKLIKLASTTFFDKEIKRKIHGRVVYKDLLAPGEVEDKKVKFHAFRKERAFKYETEYRFVIQLRREFEKEGLYYPLGDPRELPFKILINPLLESDRYSQLKGLLLKGIHSKKVQDSQLAKWLKPELW
jgi:hypothetical protein